jgi:hypothetical protein
MSYRFADSLRAGANAPANKNKQKEDARSNAYL